METRISGSASASFLWSTLVLLGLATALLLFKQGQYAFMQGSITSSSSSSTGAEWSDEAEYMEEDWSSSDSYEEESSSSDVEEYESSALSLGTEEADVQEYSYSSGPVDYNYVPGTSPEAESSSSDIYDETTEAMEADSYSSNDYYEEYEEESFSSDDSPVYTRDPVEASSSSDDTAGGDSGSEPPLTGVATSTTVDVEPPEEKRCCLCQYQPSPECVGKNQAACTAIACNDGIDNDGDGLVDYPEDPDCTGRDDNGEGPGRQQNDCVWYDEDGTPDRCIGFLERGCRRWLASSDQDSCDTTIVTKDGDSLADHREDLAQCTSLDYYRDGHGRGCNAAGQEVIACLQCVGDHCTDLNFIDVSCSTFNNTGLAVAWAEHIQDQINARGGTQTITWAANQAVSTDSCTTYLQFTIEEGEIFADVEPCHSSDDACYMAGESAWCTDDAGQRVRQTCCPHLERSGGKWQRVDSAAQCPAPPPREYTGLCRFFKERFYCSDALSGVQAQLQGCFNEARRVCLENGYTNFAVSPNCSSQRNNTLFSCTYEGSCPWTCSYE